MMNPIKRNANKVCLSMVYLATGSVPPLWNGWHFTSLLNNKNNPLVAPCLFNASIPYWEQVGLNLQCEPKKGEIDSWYILIKPIKILDK